MYYSAGRAPVIEKDPNIDKMRQDVFAAMQEIIKREFPAEEANSSGDSGGVRFVSFEEALKELANLQ